MTTVIDKRVQASVGASPTQWVADFEKMIASVDQLENKIGDLSTRIDKLAAKDATIKIKADADQFDEEVSKTETEVARLDNSGAQLTIKAMTDDALKKMMLVGEKMDLLDKQEALPSVDLKGFTETEAKIRSISAQIDALDRKSFLANVPGGVGGSNRPPVGGAGAAADGSSAFSGIGSLAAGNPLIAGIVALAPAASPLIAGLTGSVLGLAGAMGIAAVAAVPLGLELKTTFTDVSAAETAYKKYQTAVQQYGENSRQANTAQIAYNASIKNMGPSATSALEGLQQMDKELAGLKQESQQFTVPILDKAFSVIDTVLPSAVPLIKSASAAVDDLLTKIQGGVQSTGFEHFINYISKEAGPAITAFGTAGINTFEGLGHGLIAFTPLINYMEGAIVRTSDSWNKWTSGLGSDGNFQKFVTLAEDSLPKIGDLLMSVVKFVGTFTLSFSTSGMIVLESVTGIVNILSKLAEVVGPALAIVLVPLRDIVDLLNTLTGGHADAFILAMVAGWYAYNVAIGLTTALMSGFETSLASVLTLGTGGKIEKMASAFLGINPGVAMAVIGIGALVYGIHQLTSEDDAANKAASALLATMSKIDTSKFNDVSSLNNGVTAQMNQLQKLIDMKGEANKFQNQPNEIGWGMPSDAAMAQINNYNKLAIAANAAGVSVDVYARAVNGAQAAQDKLQQQYQTIQGNLNMLAQQFGVSTDAALRLANANGIDLSKSYDDIVGKFGNAVSSARDAADAQKVLASQVQELGDDTQTTSQKVQNLTDILNTLTGDKVSYVLAITNFQKAVTDLGSAVDPTNRSLDMMTAAGQRNIDAIGNVAQSMVSSITATYKHLLTTETSDQATAAITAQWNSAVTEIDKALAKLGFPPGARKDMEDQMGLTMQGLAGVIAKDAPAVASAAGATGGVGGAALNKELNKNATVTSAQMNKWLDVVNNSPIFGATGLANGKKYGIGVGSGIDLEKNDAKAASANIAAGFDVSPFHTAGVGAGSGYGVGVGTGINSNKEDARSAAAGIVSLLNGYTGIAAGYGDDIGKNFDNGVANGINNHARGVDAAAIAMIQSAHVSTNNAIGARSPARLLADTTGKWFAQGVALGIVENTDLVAAAATAMMTKAAAASQVAATSLAQKVAGAVNLTGITSVTPTSIAATQAAANPTPQSLQNQIDAAKAQGQALYDQSIDIYNSGQKNLASIQTQIVSAQNNVKLLTFYLGTAENSAKSQVPTITKELSTATTKLTDLQNQYAAAQQFTNQDLSDQNNLISTQTQLVGTLTTQLNQLVYQQAETAASNLTGSLESQLQSIQTSADNLKSTFSSGVLGSGSISNILGAATTQAQAVADAANAANAAKAPVVPTSVTEGVSAASAPPVAAAAAVLPVPVDTVQGLISGLTDQLGKSQAFANTITDLSAKGLNADYVNQIAGMGAATGQAIATALDQASTAQLQQINDLYNKLTTVANEGMDTVSKNLYSNGADAIAALIQGVIDGYPELQSVIGTVNAMLEDIGAPSSLVASAIQGAATQQAPNVSNNKTVNNHVTTNESVNPYNLSAELAWMTKVSG